MASRQTSRDVSTETTTFLPDTAVSGGEEDEAGVPVILLPNPGEGGPVAGDEEAGVPVIPLPNPGEGGPVWPGNGSTSGNRPSGSGNRPSGSNRPGSGSSSNRPNRPSSGSSNRPSSGGNWSGSGSSCSSCGSNNNNSNNSNSGSGSSWLCPNNNCSSILPGIISSIVRPGAATVRFLNAAYNYVPFRIFVDNTRFVNLLNYASASNYGQVNAGYRTVTVSGTDGNIYIQKTMPFQANSTTTIAIINTASGLDLLQITDSCCPPTNGYSSFRVGNLAYNSGPLDVIMSDGRVVYTDLRFKEVASFKRIMPGTYQFFFADTNMMPMPAYMDIETLDSAWLGVYPSQETFGSVYLDVVSNGPDIIGRNQTSSYSKGAMVASCFYNTDLYGGKRWIKERK